MANHSRGVMLRGRASGLHHWRDEASADGGKTYLRRLTRRRERTQWMREWDDEQD